MAALILWLAWSAAQTAAPGPRFPVAHRVVSVPLVERNTNWCGPAGLAAVLQYHGKQTSAKEIADAIYLPGFRGSLNLDLLVFARSQGYEAWAGEGSAEKLREAIARERPVVCMVRRENPLASRNHIVVVRGYDTQQGVWFVDSGEGAEETTKAADFEAEWSKCGRWMLVVEGKKIAAPTATERPERCSHD